MLYKMENLKNSIRLPWFVFLIFTFSAVFYLNYSPKWMRIMFPSGLVWDVPGKQEELYLTFDDGPHPEATPFVLDQLAQYNMKGTFFCIGKNVREYPEIYRRICKEGHGIGNHTMEHNNSKFTTIKDYVKSIEEAAQLIDSPHFRPPYGQLDKLHAMAIRERFPNMQIVMWSALTGDFDTSKTWEYCYAKCRQYAKPGGIIVYHDSAKAFPRLKDALPATLKWIREMGWKSVPLPH